MTGAELVEKVVAQYGTTDVFELVEHTGITLIYAHWHPMTMGEFHKKTKKICVNLNAPIEKEKIIAHELGHYFMAENGIILSRIEEEKRVGEFVEKLFLQKVP